MAKVIGQDITEEVFASNKMEVSEMPFGDGTGPRGIGPMTGKAAGYCAGFGQPGFANPIPRRGWFGLGSGWGKPYGYPYPSWYGAATSYRGRGRGFGWRWPAPYGYPW